MQRLLPLANRNLFKTPVVGPIRDEKSGPGKILCSLPLQRKDGSVRVHWKGASEIVLGLCTSFLDSDNEVHALTPEKVQELQGEIQRMAEASLRTLCLAYKELDAGAVPAGSLEEWPVPEEGLTCMAIVGIKVRGKAERILLD